MNVTEQGWEGNGACTSVIFIVNANAEVIAHLISQCSWLALGRCALQSTCTRAEQCVGGTVLLLYASVVRIPEGAVFRHIVWSAGVTDLAQLLALWHTEALHSDNTAFVVGAVLRTSAGLRQPERPHGRNHEAHIERAQGHRRCHLRACFRTAATLIL